MRSDETPLTNDIFAVKRPQQVDPVTPPIVVVLLVVANTTPLLGPVVDPCTRQTRRPLTSWPWCRRC